MSPALESNAVSVKRVEAVPVQPNETILRKSSPSVLGLSAFATTTSLFAVINLAWGVKAGAWILPAALFYGGLAQLIAGLYAFQQNHPVGGGAHGTWGAFWLTLGTWFWWTTMGAGAALPVRTMFGALGAMLILFAVPTFYVALAAHWESGATEVVLHLLWIGTAIVGIGLLVSVTLVSAVGYAILIASAIAAYYTAAALVINGATHFGEVPTATREAALRTSTGQIERPVHA
jgi:succinate-acetate transporter protein